MSKKTSSDASHDAKRSKRESSSKQKNTFEPAHRSKRTKPSADAKTNTSKASGNERSVSPARALAYELLRRIDAEHAFSNVLLRKKLDAVQLSAEDRALVTELVYGVVSWQQALDEKISQYLQGRTLASLDPGIVTILRLAFYQRLYLTRIPAYAAVHEAVTLARLTHGEGGARFVNAILRALERDPSPRFEAPTLAHERRTSTHEADTEQTKAALASRYAHPQWLVEMWLGRYGLEKTEALLAANQLPAPLFVRLRVHDMKGRDELRKALKDEGIAFAEVPGLSDALLIQAPIEAIRPYIAAGSLMVQDLSAMLVVRALQLRPGQRVLDAASAPGGKTIQIIDVLNTPTGDSHIFSEVIANEKHQRKAEMLKKRLEDVFSGDQKTSVHIEVLSQDAGTLSASKLGTFDRILLDAPCSGLGTIRRKPEIKWRLYPETLEELQKQQMTLLKAMAPLLRPNGKLVYSTCTLSPQENEDVVQHFFKACPEYRLDETLLDDLPALPGLYALHPGMVEIHPTVHGGDGFFIARFVKDASPEKPDERCGE